MKLYLSSYRIPTPNDLAGLLGKPLSDCRLAVIPNAKDYHLPNIRAQKLDELIADLAQLELSGDVVDLRDYDNSEQLQSVLSVYDLFWLAGGNTYVLRSEMHRSGFDQIITALLQTGKVYGGESAGAIVAGITLEGFEVGDDPDLANEVFWDGLGLVENIIAPHMDSLDFIEYVNHIKKLYSGNERVIYLNDNQALVVNDLEQRIVTAVMES